MECKENCGVAERREFPVPSGGFLQPAFSSLRTFRSLVHVLVVLASFQTAYGTSPSQDAPATFETLVKSATAARESGRPDEAIRDYKQALEIRPEWSEGWWQLGTLQYDNDHYAEAILAF